MMRRLLPLLLVLLTCCLESPSILAFQLLGGQAPVTPFSTALFAEGESDALPTTTTSPFHEAVGSTSRRSFAMASLAVFSSVLASPSHADEPIEQGIPVLDQGIPVIAQGIPVMKTKSGLKYLDLEPGTGPSPQYGQLVSFSYQAYVKLPSSKNNPNPKPELYETVPAYLIKHGNGRTIAGLDEGLHTMKVGGKRRLLIPPKLGYVDSGLGPLPEYPWDRRKLNRLLSQMVEVAGGTLIFEVQLLSVLTDEADQGYYQDDSLSPEDFQTLRDNLQKNLLDKRAAEAAKLAASS
jgi:hypothetical protein